MRTGYTAPCNGRNTLLQRPRSQPRKSFVCVASVIVVFAWQPEQHRTTEWVLPTRWARQQSTVKHGHSLSWAAAASSSGEEVGTRPGSTRAARREAALLLAGFVGPAVLPDPVAASAADGGGAVVVLGAGGRTGRLCAEVLRAAGRSVKALGRAEADVVKSSAEDLAAIVRGADAVIYAASASSKGGGAKDVDEQGAIKAAQACVLAGVPKYVLISSGGVARPGSLGYVATNWMPGPTWGVMDAKARGEEGTKAAVRGTRTAYTILRPGGLEDSPALGPGAMEVNQGDAVGGLVSRADVAAAAVAAASSPDTDDTTFELYAYGAAFSQQPGPTDFGLASTPTGYERRGNSWPELFQGLRKDFSKV